MPIVFPNVLIWISRSSYSASTGTSAPAPYLSEIPAHGGPISAQDYRVMPEAALTSNYFFKVDIGTDVIAEDTVTQVTLNDAPLYTPWDQLGDNETMAVVFAQNSAAGPLAHRRLWCRRVTGGGTAQ